MVSYSSHSKDDVLIMTLKPFTLCTTTFPSHLIPFYSLLYSFCSRHTCCLLFHKHFRHVFVSEPLWWLFLLIGKHFLQISTHLMSHFLQVFAQIFIFQWGLPWLPQFQLHVPHQNTWYINTFPGPFPITAINFFNTLSFIYFSIFCLVPVECKLHQGKYVFFLIFWDTPRHTINFNWLSESWLFLSSWNPVFSVLLPLSPDHSITTLLASSPVSLSKSCF